MKRGEKPRHGMRFDYRNMRWQPVSELRDISLDEIAAQIVAIIADSQRRRLSDGMRAMGFDAVEE
jgi:hypothetical protein